MLKEIYKISALFQVRGADGKAAILNMFFGYFVEGEAGLFE